MMKRGLLLLFSFLFFLNGVMALGISPAIVKLDFAPGVTHEITYSVHSEDPQQEIEAFVGGDLARYATLSEKKLIGGGNFKVIIKFPDSIDTPGVHNIGVGVKEVPTEQEFIGTAVQIQGVIKVSVPYPGRYAEAELNVPNGNVNEQIPVEVHVTNKGKENLNVNVNLEFFKDKGTGEKGEMSFFIPFKPVFLETTQDRYFRKFLNTSDFKPGNYVAEAVVSYGEETRVNQRFRIGSLFVNITNFSDSLPKGGINKFHVSIESMWNNYIKEIYADVNISNGTKIVAFRTPPVDLNAWEKKDLEGFLDTSELNGEYLSHITLYYGGEKSFADGELFIYEKNRLDFTVFIIGGIVFVLIIFIIIVLFKKFKKKYQGKRRAR